MQFLHIVNNLKVRAWAAGSSLMGAARATTKRTGWVRHGVPAPESIADHMHRMGVMAMLIQDPALKRDHCIKMAIVHDIAESLAGDITPNCGVSKEEKFRLEKEGLDQLCALLAPASIAETEIRSLWLEYEEGTTPEARLVKDLDKFEMIVQAFEYEKQHPAVAPLADFFRSTMGYFAHPEVKAWAEQLYKDRKALLGFDVYNP
ncbi:hypothetical protein H9P43_005196 [Blastocladiella emersonii ATCC 22665]|nr:hypothetical protein H9P43_005196 [Blastocladiella emersonii ATCC 22665]